MAKYFLDVTAGGKIVAFEASEKQVPLAALVDKIKIYSKRIFRFDGRKFEYSLYARPGEMVVTIKCNQLKWKLPLNFDQRGNSFYLDTSAKMQDVYMENVILVVYKRAGQTDSRVAITDLKGQTPQLTNIYDRGDICTGGLEVEDIPSPANIIAMIEGAPGNGDLSWGGQITLTEKAGRIITNHGTYGNCKPDTRTFIEDYVS